MATARVPKYLHVKHKLIGQIESGQWVTGSAFPTEAQLLQQFDVSRPTLVRSLQELVREGYLSRRQGRGTIVASSHPRQGQVTVHWFLSDQAAATYSDTRLVLTAILHGAERAAGRRHARIRIHPLPQRPLDEEARRKVGALQPEVAVVLEPSYLPGLCEHLVGSGCAVWSANEVMKGVNSVCIDQEQAGYLATRCLTLGGCSHIALLSQPAGSYWGFNARRDGYLRALGEAGIEPDPHLMLEGKRQLDSEAGRELMMRLLNLGLPLDGVVCTTDRKAIGAMAAAQEAGVRVPEDMAFIGIDDNIAARAAPPLSSVHMPFEEVGDTVVERALDDLKTTRGDVAWTSIALNPSLTIRATGGVASAKGSSERANARVDRSATTRPGRADSVPVGK